MFMTVAFWVVKGLNLLFLAGVGVILVVAYSKSKGVYDEYIEPLDEEKFKMKKYLHVGLYLSEAFPLRKFAFSKMSESEQAANAEALVGKNAVSGFLAAMNAAPEDIKELQNKVDVLLAKKEG